MKIRFFHAPWTWREALIALYLVVGSLYLVLE